MLAQKRIPAVHDQMIDNLELQRRDAPFVIPLFERDVIQQRAL